MLTYNKPQYSDLPQRIRDAIQIWNDYTVTVDETKLTGVELSKIEAYITKMGYVKQA